MVTHPKTLKVALRPRLIGNANTVERCICGVCECMCVFLCPTYRVKEGGRVNAT